jgi:hypothetical protein
MHLDVVVTDKSERPVSGLQLSDFTLLDNSRPLKLLSFHAFDANASPDSPVSLTVVVDTLVLPGLLATNERLAVERASCRRMADTSLSLSLFTSSTKVGFGP